MLTPSYILISASICVSIYPSPLLSHSIVLYLLHILAMAGFRSAGEDLKPFPIGSSDQSGSNKEIQ